MNKKRIVLAGIVVWIVSTIYSFLTCGWLFNWVYQIEPVIWKSPEAMIAAGNMVGSVVVGLLTSMIFALVFAFLYKGIPGKGAKKGLIYGFIVWLLGVFSGIIGMPFYMTIANTVVVYWLINFLIISLVNGAIVAKIYKEK